MYVSSAPQASTTVAIAMLAEQSLEACFPPLDSHAKYTVFRLQIPTDIQKWFNAGVVTMGDLELAAALLITMMLEHAGLALNHKTIAAWSDNTPTLGWVWRMATKQSKIRGRLIRGLGLRQIMNETCPVASHPRRKEQNGGFRITLVHPLTTPARGITILCSFLSPVPPPSGSLLDAFPPSKIDYLLNLLNRVRQATTAGVVDNSTRQKYWRHWEQHERCFDIDPYLQSTVTHHKIDALQAFGGRVRKVDYGQIAQVGNQSVDQAWRAVGQTCQLAGFPYPMKEAGSYKRLPPL
jgi:hypothetical protein